MTDDPPATPPAERPAEPDTGPYAGPRPYRPGEAGLFFGRDREVRHARRLWTSDRVLVLHGPAAAGKTSLVNAGLLPLVAADDGVEVLPVGRLVHQAAAPPAARPAHNPYVYTLLSAWSRGPEPPAPGTTITEALRAHPLPAGAEPPTLLAVVDQFEELFTAYPAYWPEREELIDQLAAALRDIPALKLLVVLRDDHLGAFTAYEERLSPEPGPHLRLDALGRDAAREAVTGPAAAYGRTFAEGVAEALVEDLATVTFTDRLGRSTTLVRDRVEPLYLQITCAGIWAGLTGDTTAPITADQVRTAGDAGRALAAFYAAAVAAVATEQGVAEDDLYGWVDAVFVTDLGTRGTAYRGLETTAGMPNAVADALVARQVLTEERRAAATWYQLGQDQLVRVARATAAGDAGRPPARTPPVNSGGRTVPPLPADFTAAAEAALGEGDFPAAHRYAETAADQYRRTGDERRYAQTLALQGDIARVEGDLAAAQESFRAALDGFAVLEDAHATARLLTELAGLRRRAGDYRTAIDLGRQAVQRAPDDAGALVELGYAQWLDGGPVDAEATFTRAIGVAWRHARAWAGRAQARTDMGQYAAAQPDLDRALALGLPGPDLADAHSARALFHASLGEPGRAAAELAAARGVGGADRPLTLLRAARAAALAGDAVAARRDLDRARTIGPPLPPVHAAQAGRLARDLDHDGPPVDR